MAKIGEKNEFITHTANARSQDSREISWQGASTPEGNNYSKIKKMR